MSLAGMGHSPVSDREYLCVDKYDHSSAEPPREAPGGQSHSGGHRRWVLDCLRSSCMMVGREPQDSHVGSHLTYMTVIKATTTQPRLQWIAKDTDLTFTTYFSCGIV